MVAASNANHILCLGLNHTTTGVVLRERLAFNPHQLESALARLGCGNDPAWSDIKELVILSTCNRVEIYAVAHRPVFDTLEAFLSETKSCPKADFADHIYRLLDEDAIQHLFEVAAGLDSMVIGEPQILGQVTEAYSAARKHGTTGKILSRMFESAIRAGKRARTETTISQNPASIASIAVKLIAEKVPDLPTAKIMVLGAGEMAELRPEVHVVFSAHSLPVRITKMGDPYADQLQETARLVAEKTVLEERQWSWSYQSAGRSPEPWLGPQLPEHLHDLAGRGIRKVVSVPIGFVSEHVEILYDIDIQAQQAARDLGIRLARPPALNDDPLFIAALADSIRDCAEEQGWSRPIGRV